MTQVVASGVAETEPKRQKAQARRNNARASRHWIVLGMLAGGVAGLAYVSLGSVARVNAQPVLVGTTERVRPSLLGGADRKLGAVESTNALHVLIATTTHQDPVGGLPEAVVPMGQDERPWLRNDPESRRICGASMQLVKGDYCTAVAHRCVEPFDDGSGRCRRYTATSRCYPPVIGMRFCIDRYEYPNRVGEKPMVMVDYTEAVAACAKEQKRLCSAREWTLACEGPRQLPYPQGYVRDPIACNIDQAHRFPDLDALANDKTREQELFRIDQRSPSGARPDCVSAYGVYDLTGNVDEWVTPDGPEEPAGSNSRTALKGGYYGTVRARCRPATTSHGPTFKFYQVGFRCCSDASAEVPTRGVDASVPKSMDALAPTVFGAAAGTQE